MALKAGKAATVQGESVTIGFGDGKVQINGATLLNADLKTSNGVIHVIDSVLLPPQANQKHADMAGCFFILDADAIGGEK